jgi:hypothetical protein
MVCVCECSQETLQCVKKKNTCWISSIVRSARLDQIYLGKLFYTFII